MRRADGYTLVEVLVAVLVFSVLAASAYVALDGLSRSAIGQREHAEALAGLQLGVARLESDLRQLSQRARRNALGQIEPAFSGSARGLSGVRAGWINPTGLRRSHLQRFAWQFEGGELARLSWPVTDPTEALSPAIETLDLDLEAVEWRYRDSTGAWHDQWPPRSGGAGPLPLAIEVLIDHERFGRIRRLLVISS
ncbi:type II secretion system minor pseudopilin GspJ [Wenzhouxiangella marina]|uniref:Type II secretion system protein J n=1 Tax=Wenzhouxiangella marina TaxID=1579979 RepID=A0A0K0XTJ3_9GAMM|nr:type II secretion system minor pseudopilin GspJ [Wenzhouxiangella marina]AKS40942.1 hypothetical protein WM2015_560 [Wenzhouxiangella marina]MBB6087816.1 general secretion pathway protein J [Wenzhouxiangella marina]